MVSHCPSHDWDRYVDDLDRAAEEQAFIQQANRNTEWKRKALQFLVDLKEDLGAVQRFYGVGFHRTIADIETLLEDARDEQE